MDTNLADKKESIDQAQTQVYYSNDRQDLPLTPPNPNSERSFIWKIVVIIAIPFLPIIISILSGLVAAIFGCQVNAAGAQCVVFGHDFSNFLYKIGNLYIYSIFTLIILGPPMFILLIVELVRHKN